MIHNYIKVFFRNFGKNKVYYSLNILGLSIGFACSIIAGLYIVDQVGYDRFHKDYENIYRLNSHFIMDGRAMDNSTTLLNTGEKLLNKVPEVEDMTRITAWLQGGSLIRVNEDYFPGINALITDSNFLKVFSFELIQGNPGSFLKGNNQVAITESLAKKVYKTPDPIGEELWFKDKKYVVSWLMKDPPKNSHLQFDMLFPYDVFPSNYYSLDIYTYIKLNKSLNSHIAKKVNAITAETLEKRFEDHGDNFRGSLIPLEDIYLSNEGWLGVRGNKKSLYIFGFLSIFILVIAVINFINLLTAKSEHRAKEVGLRKVSGASKRNLRFQFIGETVLISFIALFLGLVLAEFLTKPVNNLLSVDIAILNDTSWMMWIAIICFPLLIGVLSGIYPAFVLSRYKPANVIKGIFTVKGNPNFLKILLVIIQFSIATLLIFSVLVFIFQINYLKTKDLGFDEKNLLVVHNNSKQVTESYLSLKHELLNNPNISHVTASHSIPGSSGSGMFIHFRENDPKTAISVNEYKVQDDFVETFGMQLLAGRSLSGKEYGDSNAFIINEATAKLLGDKNPVGRNVKVHLWEGKIVGLVKDFHFLSLRNEIGPLVLSRYADHVFKIVIRIHPNERQETIQFVKNKFMEFDQSFFWNYHFVHDIFKKKYFVEERMFKILLWGSIIAIILSFLGLFALTSYTISKKYKEIGIRKVQGASVVNIVYLLNRNILRWVLLTNIIAWPLGFYIMNNWLNNFANRINIQIWFFIVAGAISFVIAWVTIVTRARKAARMNPVDAIKYE